MKKLFLPIVLLVSFVISVALLQPRLYSNLNSELDRIWGLSDLDKDIAADIEPYILKMEVSSDGRVVNISWEGMIDENLAYKVYRANTPIINRTILNDEAIEVSFVFSTSSDNKFFTTVDIPEENGSYYYAVVPILSEMAIIFRAEPNVDISIEPVSIMVYAHEDVNVADRENTIDIKIESTDAIVSSQPSVPSTDVVAPVVPIVPVITEPKPSEPEYIRGIATRLYSGNNVAISWDVVAGDNIEYTVYRAHAPISNESVLSLSSKVASTKHSFVNDRLNAEIDTYYYVTSSSFDSTDFVSGQNYTVVAVEPKIERFQRARETSYDINRAVYYKVNSLTAKFEDGKALLQWKDPAGLPTNEYYYLLFTSTSNFYIGQNVITDSFLSMAEKLVPSQVEENASGFMTYIDENASNMIGVPLYYSIVIVANGSVPTVVLGSGMYTRTAIVPREFQSNLQPPPPEQQNQQPEQQQNIENDEPLEEHKEDDIVSDEGKPQDAVVEPENKVEDKPAVVKPVVKKDQLAETRELYTKASLEFNKKNYAAVKKLLEGKTISNADKKLYYDTNLILAISYYRLSDKVKALNTLKKIRSISPSEVDFWAGQILGDL